MYWSILSTLVLSLFSSSFAAPTTSTSTSNSTTGPSACVVFDISWNLLAFGFNGKDYNAGTQDTWDSGTSTDITKSGRPPFNSANTTCYLAQFYNVIYVLNADKANPSYVYIYDATASSWSTQITTLGQFDPTNFAAILDHDTNVFYAYSNTNLFSLDMGSLKAAQSTAIPWIDVQSPDLSIHTTNQEMQTPGANTAGYQPVMALAENHIFFFNVPGFDKGTVKIFIIHYSSIQPTPQTFSPASFPTMYGKAVSIFQPNGRGVQTEVAFIPDDFSGTYVLNVISNTTKTLSAPPVDLGASFTASTNAILMLGSDGVVRSLAYDPNTTTSGGTWNTVSKLPTVDFTSSPVSNGVNNSNSNSNVTVSDSSNSSSTSSKTSGTSIGLNSGMVPWGALVGSIFALIGAVL